MKRAGLAARLWFLWAGCLVSASAMQLAHVGSAACESCHPAQYRTQVNSGHAQTLRKTAAHPLARSFTPRNPLQRAQRYNFAYRLAGNAFEVRVYDKEFAMQLPLEWAFGAGEHAVTFVSRINDQSYIEHAFTYFTKSQSLDLTPGHEKLRSPTTIHEAMGLLYPTRNHAMAIVNCFGCHSTGPVTLSSQGEVATFENGVGCEVCHGPGSAHLEAIRQGDTPKAVRAIQNPGRLQAEQTLQLCGQCHRRPEQAGLNVDFKYEWNVRHQPPYLGQSKCFQKSDGKLSCFTCHDPHERVRRAAQPYYRTKCEQCHSEGLSERHGGDVSAADCTDCHMPAVQVSSQLSFKNHWIGIYSDGSRLVPAR